MPLYPAAPSQTTTNENVSISCIFEKEPCSPFTRPPISRRESLHHGLKFPEHCKKTQRRLSSASARYDNNPMVGEASLAQSRKRSLPTRANNVSQGHSHHSHVAGCCLPQSIGLSNLVTPHPKGSRRARVASSSFSKTSEMGFSDEKIGQCLSQDQYLML